MSKFYTEKQMSAAIEPLQAKIYDLQASNEQLKERIAEVEKEREQTRRCIDEGKYAEALLRAELDEADVELEKAKARLAKYGGHTTQCSKIFHPLNTVCDCGFESVPEAKEATEGEPK